MWAFINSAPRWSSSHRTFLTLPKLPDLPPWSSQETQTYHERKVLPYRQKELYDVVADVASYNRFIPFCTGSRIVRPSIGIPVTGTAARRSVMEAELTVGFLAFKESYVSRVTCDPYTSVEAVASSSTPLFKTLSTTWRFHPTSAHSPYLAPQSSRNDSHKDDRPTIVTLDLVYAFANPIHASLSSAFFGQVSKLMVKAFEDRCLEVYGPR